MAEEHFHRMCIFCRGTAHQDELLRFTIEEGRLVWNEREKRSGRGVYMHPRLECWAKMKEVGRWRNAFEPRSKRKREGRTEGGVTIEKGSLEEAQEKVRTFILSRTT